MFIFRPICNEFANFGNLLVFSLICQDSGKYRRSLFKPDAFRIRALSGNRLLEFNIYTVFDKTLIWGSIVLGHILDALVLALVQTGVLSIIAFFMSVRMVTGLTGLLLGAILLFSVVFFVASISYTLSMVIPNENAFIAMANTLTLPLFFLSTALLTKEQAPVMFRVLMSINPFTYAIDSLRNLIMITL